MVYDPCLFRYLGYGAFFAGIYLIYQTKPLESLDIKYWAKPRATLELEEEMKMLDKLSASPDLQERLKVRGWVPLCMVHQTNKTFSSTMAFLTLYREWPSS